jgi:hypothetical protein
VEATLTAVVPAGLYSSSYLQFGRCASMPQRRAYVALSFEGSIFAHSFEISALPKGMSEPDFGLSGGIVMSTGKTRPHSRRSQPAGRLCARNARCATRAAGYVTDATSNIGYHPTTDYGYDGLSDDASITLRIRVSKQPTVRASNKQTNEAPALLHRVVRSDLSGTNA